MSRPPVCLALVLTALGWPVHAQSPVATATSPQPFRLRGVNLGTGQGVPAWPVLPGDPIQAGTAPVTLTFPNGSVIVLNPGASARITLSGQTPVAQILTGCAAFQLNTPNAVRLQQNNAALNPTSRAGQTAGCSPAAANPFWTQARMGHLSAGMGGLIGAGLLIVKAVSAGPSVSPSR